MNTFYKLSLKALALAAISFMAVPAQAQLGNIGDLLKSGKEDANKLVEGYMAPMANAFGAGMNTGWILNANAHGGFLPIPLPGFSLQFRSGLTMIPTDDQTVDLSTLGLSSKVSFPNGNTTPTIAGGKDGNATVRITETVSTTVGGQTVSQDVILANLEMPDGLDVPFFPLPMVQAGVGLIFDTDLTVRYFPKTDFGDYGSVELVGASVKHGLDQWIPGGGLLPVNITLQAGFTQFKSSANLSLLPTDYSGQQADIANYATYAAKNYDGQQVQFETTAWTANLLVGKKLSLVVIGLGAYVGAGIESSTTILKVNGNYPILVPNTSYTLGGPTLMFEDIPDPIDLEFTGANSMRLLGGVRFSLGIFDFFGEYTLSKYPTANAGFAISFRS